MLSSRSSANIRADVDATDEQWRALGRRLSALKIELAEALVKEASERAHPWVGKTVSKAVRVGYPGKTVKRVGVVTIYDPARHRGVRGLYNIAPGEMFVRTKSGATGYSWLECGKSEPSWALEE